MDADTLEEEWDLLTDLLPLEWKRLARTTGALQRARKVRDADTLLRLILLHTAAGLSLRQATARADRAGLAHISDVALLKRLRNAETWLHELAVRMLEDSRFAPRLDAASLDRRIRVVDATTVTEPGSTGTDWRLHYVLQLPALACDFFELTDPAGGETYKRVPLKNGDVILGDRGYGHREGVAYVVDEGGDVVVRLNGSGFPLEDEAGAPVAVLDRLRSLDGHTPTEWPVTFEAFDRRYRARLCAVRKSREAAKQAHDAVRKRASNKGQDVRDATLELAEYVIVLTTLAQDALGTEGVLELYGARWQVELAFKRIKSLFGVGHVPKNDPRSARAWLYAKLVAVLLIERLIEAAELFSPWGFRLGEPKPVA